VAPNSRASSAPTGCRRNAALVECRPCNAAAMPAGDVAPVSCQRDNQTAPASCGRLRPRLEMGVEVGAYARADATSLNPTLTQIAISSNVNVRYHSSCGRRIHPRFATLE
jgi:hypothetical protein